MIVIISLVTLLLPFYGFAAQKAGAVHWLDKPVTLRFPGEPLSKVLDKLGKQAGISVFYDQELANDIVRGNYKAVKFSEAVTRLFKGKNKIIQVNNDKKLIVVKTFGTKRLNRVGGQDSSIPITTAELEEIHAQHQLEYQESFADENEVFEGGLTLEQIRLMHEQQYKDYKASLLDPDEVLIEGLTRRQLHAIHELQYKESNEI